jgi:catechol 2,3-dioxygenase-like lactoylglutathione lyase family enzyme
MTPSREPVTRFDHITIATHTIETAAVDYAALLGHPPTWRGSHPELGTESALFGLENAMIELTAPRAGAEESEGLRGWLSASGGGLQSLAFGTDDATAASKTLRERGVRATPPQPGAAHDADGATRSYQTVELSPRASRGVPVLIVERPDFAALTSTQPIPAACVHALDHVVLRTSNIDAAKSLYGTALGIRLALERDINGIRMLFFRVGGVTLEIVEDTSQGDVDVFYGAAYRVRDIQAAHQRLTQAGFDLSPMRAGHKNGTNVFSVRDRTHNVATLILHDRARA